MKLLIGGSPCTYWSIAQTKNRETEASGMGWELFKNFLIARDKYKPDYFLYENNKSMSPSIRAQITKEFGFEPVMIDSALVSAQSRKRLYWLGRREPDGTYSRVNVESPEDRGIILRDILEHGVAFREKAYTLDANYYKTTGTFNPKKQHIYSRHQAAEPINTTVNEKGFAVKAHYGRTGITEMLCGGGYFPASGVAEMVCENPDGQLQLIDLCVPPIPLNTTEDGKAQCLRATCYKDGVRNMVGNNVDQRTCVAETVRSSAKIQKVGNMYGKGQNGELFSIDGKSKTLSAGTGVKGKGIGSSNAPKVIYPIRIGTIESETKKPDQDSQPYRAYSPDGKSVTLCGAGGGLEQRPDCTQFRSARANACPGGNKAGICGNPARGMCGLVHAVQQDKEGQTNE